jgi:hypothetical protein
MPQAARIRSGGGALDRCGEEAGVQATRGVCGTGLQGQGARYGDAGFSAGDGPDYEPHAIGPLNIPWSIIMRQKHCVVVRNLHLLKRSDQTDASQRNRPKASTTCGARELRDTSDTAYIPDMASDYRSVARNSVAAGRKLLLAEDIVDPEWAEWYSLSPAERWLESSRMWTTFLSLGGLLDPEPDTQSPFHDPGEQRTEPAHGWPGVRVVRRSGV